MMDYRNRISEYIRLEKEILDVISTDEINDICNIIHCTYQNQGNIYIMGNGGSASTASHLQNDFEKCLNEQLASKFKVYCLNNNIAIITAIANDINYQEIYRFQLKGKLTDNDLVIVISGSGNSPNIINAVEYANSLKVPVIGMVGYDGGRIKEMVDYVFHVPVNNMQIVEDVHLMINHLLVSIFSKIL